MTATPSVPPFEAIPAEAPPWVEVHRALCSREPEPLSESLPYLGIKLDAGTTRYFEQLEMMEIGWSLKADAQETKALLDSPWLKETFPDHSPEFLLGDVLSGWIGLPGLYGGMASRREQELDTSLSMCRADGAPADPAQFFTLESHFSLRALLRDTGEGMIDRVWLHHQADPWLEPTDFTIARYLECAFSVRGLRNWQLALLDDRDTKRTIAQVLPHCFPDAKPDAALV